MREEEQYWGGEGLGCRGRGMSQTDCSGNSLIANFRIYIAVHLMRSC